eukprot:753960-Hanusia_phi.AAC.1
MENWRVRQDLLLTQRDSLEATVLRLTMELGKMRMRKGSSPGKQEEGSRGAAGAVEDLIVKASPEPSCSKKKRKSEEVCQKGPTPCLQKENENPQLLASRPSSTPMKLASSKEGTRSGERQVTSEAAASSD